MGQACGWKLVQGLAGFGQNRAQVLRDMGSKRLAQWLGEHVQAKQFFPRRKEGLVFEAFVPLAKIEPISQFELRVAWNREHSTRLGINTEEAEAFVKNSVADPVAKSAWL